VLTLSVVVPATDAPLTLERCRAAIAAADDPPDEVIVVEGPAELSAAGARNAGVERACGKVVVFVDADVEVHADAFARVRAAFTARPQLAAVFGSYDDAPSALGLVSRFRNLLHHHVHQEGAGPAETFWTGLGAVRRSSFVAVGGFDEQRFPHPSIEDIDLGARLRSEGEEILLDPTIQGKHLKAWTLRSMMWTDFARRGIPWVGLQLRNRQASTALNCGWRHRVSALACAAAVVTVLLGQFRIAALAVGAFVAVNRSFYQLLARRLGVVDTSMAVLLHGLHHLVAVVAVPAGILVALSASRRGPAGSALRPSPEDVVT
jgi:GT2 family glycosyltransferase